jgi:hypothetical protein
MMGCPCLWNLDFPNKRAVPGECSSEQSEDSEQKVDMSRSFQKTRICMSIWKADVHWPANL